jgi:hypothetical protein
MSSRWGSLTIFQDFKDEYTLAFAAANKKAGDCRLPIIYKFQNQI